MDYMDEHEDKTPIELAFDELKRVDHLIFVSLKYTRTVDVLKNVVHRFISTYDFAFDALLMDMKEKGKIDEIPKSYLAKTDALIKAYENDQVIAGNLGRYLMFRKLVKADFEKREEFRRHVTLTAIFDSETKREVNIDNITEDFKKLGDFVRYVHQKMLLKD